MSAVVAALMFVALMSFISGAPAWAQSAPANASAQKSGTTTKPSGSALLSLDSGRASRDLVVTTGVRGYKRPSSKQIHALILAAGEYTAPGVTPLKGVVHDIQTAKEIAVRLGVPDTNLTVVQNKELTLQGIRTAFKTLEERIAPGDDVFVYYTGHGARQLIQDARGDRCGESLVTIDGFAFSDQELSEYLERLSGTAKKIIVFFDACHSGGVSTRSAKAADLVPKTTTLPGQGKSCSIPANLLKRSITAKSKTPGAGGQNYVYIAAARDDEVAFDNPKSGGLASQAWLACLKGEAKDLDRSGGLSARELVDCAQKKVNEKIGDRPTIKPHNISITGNADLVLSYLDNAVPESVAIPASETASAPVAPVATATTPAPSATSAIASSSQVPAALSTQPVKIAPLSTLNDMYQGRDDRRLVTLTAPKTTLKIKQDRFDFSVYSREAGYLYILMAGSDGETFDILFPNQIDSANKIGAGETLRLPRSSWRLTAGGPVGKNTILAVVSDGPRDFSTLNVTKAGPFSVVNVTPIAAKDIQLVTLTSAVAEQPDCQQPLKRNLVISKECSNSYGAAKLDIEEVQ